jgi:hypothetical protein
MSVMLTMRALNASAMTIWCTALVGGVNVVIDELLHAPKSSVQVKQRPTAKERSMESYLSHDGKRAMTWRRQLAMPALAGLCAVLTLAAAPSARAASRPHVVVLQSQSSAGIHGSATLTALGQRTKVSVVLVNDPAGAQHPAHIHSGTCVDFNVLPRYALDTVIAGKSVTIIDAPLIDLLNHGLVLEVHSSKYHVNIIAACGVL